MPGVVGAVNVEDVVPLGKFKPDEGMRGNGLNRVLSLVTVVKVVGQLISVTAVVLPPDHVMLTGKLAPVATVFDATVAAIVM